MSAYFFHYFNWRIAMAHGEKQRSAQHSVGGARCATGRVSAGRPVSAGRVVR